MQMVEKRVLLCDKCGSEGAVRWVAGPVGKPMREVDLCPSCVAEVKALFKPGRPHNTRARQPYRKFTKVQVAPVENKG